MIVFVKDLKGNRIADIPCDDYSINNGVIFFYNEHKLFATLPINNFIITFSYDL
jgi:hypothetical protein